MTVQELLKKGKKKIRTSENLSELFSQFYSDNFKGAIASFCCTFSDYDRLHRLIFKKNIAMELKKYKVTYKPNDILFYVEDKKIHRMYAKRVDDKFISKFLELHDSIKFPNVDKYIISVEEEEVKLTAKEAVAYINQAELEQLDEFMEDNRKTVQSALESRLNELTNE